MNLGEHAEVCQTSVNHIYTPPNICIDSLECKLPPERDQEHLFKVTVPSVSYTNLYVRLLQPNQCNSILISNFRGKNKNPKQKFSVSSAIHSSLLELHICSFIISS